MWRGRATHVERAEGALLKYWSLSSTEQIPGTVQSKIRLRPRSDCTIAFLPAWSGRPEAFLKIFPNLRSLQNEAGGLEHAGQITSASLIAVPRILEVIPDLNAVLLEFVPGPTMDSMLRRQLIHFSMPCKDVWAQLGTWLRSYHDSAAVIDNPAEFLQWESSQVESCLRQLRGILEAGVIEKIELLKSSIARRLPVGKCTLVRCHGDFGLYNLISAGHRVWITDFAYNRLGPRAFDMERLWDSLEDAIGFLPGFGSLQNEIRSLVTSAYGEAQIENGAIAELIQLELRLKKIYFLKTRVPSSSIRRWWRSFLLGKTIAGFHSWLDHCEE